MSTPTYGVGTNPDGSAYVYDVEKYGTFMNLSLVGKMFIGPYYIVATGTLAKMRSLASDLNEGAKTEPENQSFQGTGDQIILEEEKV